MKLNINANVIKSPVNSEMLIADSIRFETNNLIITVDALEVNVPIRDINGDGTPQGNWMLYQVKAEAWDLINRYPQVHAHQSGGAGNQSPYDFQLTIGDGISRGDLPMLTNTPAKRYVEVVGVEANSEELAVRQVLSIVAGQLLTTHRLDPHVVNLVGVHVAEQLIQAGMTHFKSGDIKLDGMLLASGSMVKTERLWRLGNPGEGKLTLKHTLLSQQTGPHSRATHLIPADQHHIYGVDGKYAYTNGMNNTNPWYPGMSQPGIAGGMAMQSGMAPQYMQMQQGIPPQRMMTSQGFSQPMAPGHFNGMNSGAGFPTPDQVNTPVAHNRSLKVSDLGGRDDAIPRKGMVARIEIDPIRIKDDTVEVVEEGSSNAYGVYRREMSLSGALAVSVGDFLNLQEASEYAHRLADKYHVNVRGITPYGE